MVRINISINAINHGTGHSRKTQVMSIKVDGNYVYHTTKLQLGDNPRLIVWDTEWSPGWGLVSCPETHKQYMADEPEHKVFGNRSMNIVDELTPEMHALIFDAWMAANHQDGKLRRVDTIDVDAMYAADQAEQAAIASL